VNDAQTHRLREGAKRLGVELSAEQAQRLGRLLGLLLEWNQRINLTAVRSEEEAIDRHLLDSLAPAPLLEGVQSLVDVGSGPGLPGLVLAVARPELRVTSVESIQKKCAFQTAARIALGLPVEVVCARDEALVRAGRTFDAAISRATWDPPEWVVRAKPLVRPGGLILTMQTCDAPELSAPDGTERLAARAYEVGGVARRLQPFRRLG
jgi:16S rRNA (guanine527-N7)-methyltransferase